MRASGMRGIELIDGYGSGAVGFGREACSLLAVVFFFSKIGPFYTRKNPVMFNVTNRGRKHEKNS